MTPTFSEAEKKTYAPVVRMLLQIVIDAVKEGGDMGAPAGVMMAAMMVGSPKITPQHFETIMRALVENGNVRQAGDLYFFVKDLTP